jgi:hypothetical protein
MRDLHVTLARIGGAIMARLRITNEEKALEAIKQNGLTLRYVPKNLKTAELFVPENLKTTELCLEAVKNLLEKDLEIVPEALRDEVRAALKSGE